MGKELESVFNKMWTEKIIYQVKQKGDLKRLRDDTDTDNLSTGKLCITFFFLAFKLLLNCI